MKISFLGDIHGSWGVLREVLKRHRDDRIIQVGDLGLGFPTVYKGVDAFGEPRAFHRENDPLVFPDRFSFIAGNHDNPDACRRHPNYRGDYGFDKATGIFHVSGGYSIDHALRTEGVDWWRGEELSIGQLNEAVSLYESAKPKIMLTHEPPASIHKLLVHAGGGASRTSQALEAMLEIHRPEKWIFGHHHKVWKKTFGETDFICVAINQVYTIDVRP